MERFKLKDETISFDLPSLAARPENQDYTMYGVGGGAMLLLMYSTLTIFEPWFNKRYDAMFPHLQIVIGCIAVASLFFVSSRMVIDRSKGTILTAWMSEWKTLLCRLDQVEALLEETISLYVGVGNQHRSVSIRRLFFRLAGGGRVRILSSEDFEYVAYCEERLARLLGLAVEDAGGRVLAAAREAEAPLPFYRRSEVLQGTPSEKKDYLLEKTDDGGAVRIIVTPVEKALHSRPPAAISAMYWTTVMLVVLSGVYALFIAGNTRPTEPYNFAQPPFLFVLALTAVSIGVSFKAWKIVPYTGVVTFRCSNDELSVTSGGRTYVFPLSRVEWLAAERKENGSDGVLALNCAGVRVVVKTSLGYGEMTEVAAAVKSSIENVEVGGNMGTVMP